MLSLHVWRPIPTYLYYLYNFDAPKSTYLMLSLQIWRQKLKDSNGKPILKWKNDDPGGPDVSRKKYYIVPWSRTSMRRLPTGEKMGFFKYIRL